MTTTKQHDEYFIPLDNNDALDVPDSVSGDSEQLLLSNPALALKPMRFLSRAASGLFALLMVFVVWQSVQFFEFLLNSHWLLATAFSILLIALIGITGRAALDFFRYQQDFREIDQLSL